MSLFAGLRTRINHLRFKTISYSQEGEDCVLQRIFEGQKKGFYVDVGAHHPIRFSNTYLFYKQGWKGINIDAMPGSMKLFNFFRPNDINLETAIAEVEKEINYYMFNEPALNGFSEEISEGRNKIENYKITKKIKLKTQTLASVLNDHVLKGQEIDFLSVDVEGLDLEVLKSNDWNRFKPRLILAEVLNSNFEDIKSNDVYQFLIKKNYKLTCKTYNTCFFEIS